jgi:hypothetical protein
MGKLEKLSGEMKGKNASQVKVAVLFAAREKEY